MSMNFVPTRIVLKAVWWYCKSADTWVHDFNQDPPVTQQGADKRLNSPDIKLTLHDAEGGWLGYNARKVGMSPSHNLIDAMEREMSAWFSYDVAQKPAADTTITEGINPLLAVLGLAVGAVVYALVVWTVP